MLLASIPHSGPLLLTAAALLAAACASSPTQPAEILDPPTTPSDPYVISVSRPVGGTVVSADGRIDCGTAGGDSVACSPARYESSVTFRAIPDPGFRFVGWAADCSGTEPRCTIDTRRSRADKWVAAAFEPLAAYRGTYFLVTVIRPDHGTVTSKDGKIRCGRAPSANLCGPVLYPWKHEVKLSAIPDPSHRFEGWSGDCAGLGGCKLRTESSESDKTVAAAFAQR